MSLIMASTVARTALAAVLGVLYGVAYAVIGYYVAATIAAFQRAVWVFDVSLLVWIAVGVIGLTVWTLRFAGIDVRKTTRPGGAR